ncbi:MAG: TolC family outer membrane protein [Oleiphilaceae bacterium]|nr:TolC family outer membrane protein [Oleiphilaceae bacterium]
MMTFKKVALRGLMASILGSSPVFANSTDLISLYREAVNYDAEIAAAKAGLYAEQTNEDLRLSFLLPQINGEANYGHTNSNKQIQSSDSYETTSYSVTLTQPLFNLPNWYDLNAAELNSARAQAVYLAAEQDLILDVATAYFAVLRTQENLTAAKALETAVKRQYEQAKEQFDVGLIAITDVHEAKASYDDAQTNRIRSEGDVTIAVENLNRLTGKYTPKVHLLKDDFPISLDQEKSVEDWVTAAYENNLNIKAAEYALKSLEEGLKADKSGHLPSLNLSASYENTDLSNFSPRNNTREESSIFLNLNVPLYSGGATQATARQTRYLTEQARHQLAAAKRAAQIQTRTEYINLRTNIQTVEALRQNIVSRESALEATREGYKVGTRNIVEVLDAERNYFTALRDYANARFDFIESSLRIRASAGTLSSKDIEELNQWLKPASK